MEEYGRLLIEIGVGVDQHGQDPSKAAVRAVRDAVQRVCIPGFRELGLSFDKARLIIDIYTPLPEETRRKDILDALPARPREGEIIVNIHRGGALVKGIYMPEYGDRGDEIIVVVAAITIAVPRAR